MASMASFLKAASSYYYYTNQTKQHSINRRRIIIPTTQISLSSIIIPTTTTTTGFITTTKSKCSTSSSRASTFRVQCFKQQVEEKEKERKPNQNPFEIFSKALKKLPVYHIYSIVLLMVSRSPIVIGVLLVLDLCLLISSLASQLIEKNGGEIVLDVGLVLGLILFFPIMFMLVYDRACHPPQKCTVIKFQVGLLGLTPSLQKIFMAFGIGLKNFLICSTPLLKGGVFYQVDVKRSIKDGEEHLEELCIEERGKLDEEMPVNVNNTEKQSATSKRANEFSNEYHVITILLVAKGVHELAAINGSENLKEALQKLGSISSIDNLAVEVLLNEKGIPTERLRPL